MTPLAPPATPSPAGSASAPVLRALRGFGWAWLFAAFLPPAHAAVLVQLDATTYQTEHCLFIVDPAVQWSSPIAAYADLYASPFPRLNAAFTKLTALFPGSYFSVCYVANTGDSRVPNYIDQLYKAAGISTGPGSAGIGNGDPTAPQSFATVDFCRYNLSSAPFGGALAVFDHELGHAWGAQFFNNVSGTGPGILSNGHWLGHATIDCQLGSTYSADGGLTVNKLYGDPAGGFRYQRVDNLRSNDTATFSEQTLYLLGAADRFPTTYVLNSPVYRADLTVGASSVESYDHAAALARYGPRTPDFRTAPKRLKVAIVYLARDAAEVNAVAQALEQSAEQFGNGEALDPARFRFQTPFLVNTRFRASVDTRLSDLDGVPTPSLSVADSYTASTDGSAVIAFTATDPAGPAPTVTVLPASTQCTVVGNTVQVSGLPDGAHFFTLKAANAAGKRTFAHFVVEVQRPVTSTAIATPPATQTVVAGQTASFAVVAGGTPPFTYQWFRQAARTSTWNRIADGGGYSGATAANLIVSSSTDLNGDRFLCMVTNAVGEATSAAAALVVNETTPVLSAGPVDTAIAAGNVARFTVTTVGPPLTYGYSYYQWQKQPAAGGAWSDLADSPGAFVGATTASLTIYGTTVAMSGDRYRCVVSNTAGATTSTAGTVTVSQAPAIVTHPASVSASLGQDVTFTVVANGTAPLTYQWQKFSALIPGATGATLTLTNVQMGDIGSYGVKVSNAAGSVLSNFASLSVAAIAPAITTHPQSQTVSAGADAIFTVAASGSLPFGYQWMKNGANIPGATFSNYTVFGAQAGDAGNYAVSVRNSAGTAISATALLTVNSAPPAIVTHPQSVSILAGAAATFTVAVSGTAPFTYQWSKNNAALAGATGASYAIPGVQAGDVGTYAVTVTNSAGQVTSNAATLGIVVAVTAPALAAPPQGVTVNAGSPVSLAVTVTGTAPFSYQWFRDGIALAGATSATYALAAAQSTDAGNYTVRVTNSAGQVTSPPATVVVRTNAPVITGQPQAASVTAGSPVTFTVAASGTPPLAYQWFRDGAALSGATDPDYRIASASPAEAGLYTVTVSNGGGAMTSEPATLVVLAAGTLPTTLLSNLSVRTTLAAGQKLIPGFVTNGAKTLLLRAAGPALTALGVGLNGLGDPLLQVYDRQSALVAENDNWPAALAPTFAQLGAFDFGAGSKDAALLAPIDGPNSAFVTGAGSGIVLMELYDTQIDPSHRLVNVSARNHVGVGADALIVGFVITGSGTKQLLIRGVGPTLARYGVGDALADPYLELYNQAGQKLAENDTWAPGLAPTFAQLGAFALDAGSKDAAFLITLPPGVYSVKLTGTAQTTGEGLVEVYEIWP